MPVVLWQFLSRLGGGCCDYCCSCCCGITSLPDTIHATFANVNLCAKLDGVSVALVRDHNVSCTSWTYGDPNVDSLGVSWSCVCTGSPSLAITCGPGVAASGGPDPGGTCTPLHFVYSNLTFSAVNLCCSNGIFTGTVNVVISV